MENDLTKGLIQKLIYFTTKFETWNTANFDGQFDKNGKSDYELTKRKYTLLFLMQKFNLSTISELEMMTCISKSSLSLTLSKLVKEGYITKEEPRSSEDGRNVFFYITPKGVEAYNRTCEDLEKMFANFYYCLTPKQKLDLSDGIEKLNKVF